MVIVIGELALVVVIVIGVLGFVVVIVMGMLVDSLRLLDGPGSAAGMASLAVGLGLAVALGLAVGGPRVRLGESDPVVPIKGLSIGPDEAASPPISPASTTAAALGEPGCSRRVIGGDGRVPARGGVHPRGERSRDAAAPTCRRVAKPRAGCLRDFGGQSGHNASCSLLGRRVTLRM